jgi:GNAT superfamily N-acetyltransferase
VIIVKRYAAEHRDGIVALILPIQQAEFAIPITLDDQPDLLDIEGFYQRGKGNFWVALDGDMVVGTISLLDIGNGQGALRKMFVNADYRGKELGVSQRLLNTLFDWSREQDIAEVLLGTTAKYLAAHRFYEKNGFIEIRKGELPSSFPVLSVDTKFYKRLLRNYRG